MLLPVTLLCSSLVAPPLPDGADRERLLEELYHDTVIKILGDLLENCILLVDSQQALEHIVSTVRGWPVGVRKPATELLEQFRREHKIAVIPSGSGSPARCVDASCRGLMTLALSQHPRAILAARQCRACIRRQGAKSEIVEVLDYGRSEFASGRARLRWVDVPGDRAMTLGNLENEVLRPLFRFTRRVEIMDKEIGRTLGDARGRYNLKQEFEESLGSLLSVFAEVAPTSTTRYIDLYTAVRTPSELDTATRAKFRAQVVRWAEQVSKQCAAEVKVHLKAENGQAFPHARYLLTDQLCILVERGFDFLGRIDANDRRASYVKATVFALAPARSAMVEGYRRLPDMEGSPIHLDQTGRPITY